MAASTEENLSVMEIISWLHRPYQIEKIRSKNNFSKVHVTMQTTASEARESSRFWDRQLDLLNISFSVSLRTVRHDQI